MKHQNWHPRQSATQIAAKLPSPALVQSDPAETVHQVRVTIKRMRSLLRLIRTSTGGEFFRSQNARLRLIARGLSPHRDEMVVLTTCQYLRRRRMPPATRHFLSDSQHRLEKILGRRDGHLPEHIRQARQTITSVARQIAQIPLSSPGLEVARRGVRKAFRQARSAYRMARAKPTTQCCHELRKRAKTLLYQLEILRDFSSQWAREQIQELDRLGGRLGHLNDLAVLEAHLGPIADAELKPSQRQKFHRVLERRAQKLRSRALKAAGRVLKRTPKAYCVKVFKGRKAG